MSKIISIEHISDDKYKIIGCGKPNEKITIDNINVISDSGDGFTFFPITLSQNVISGGEEVEFKIKLNNSENVNCDLKEIKIKFEVSFNTINEYTIEIIDKDLSGKNYIYSSKELTDRKYFGNILKLDSIYRPFFFNTVILMTPNEKNEYDTKLFFSIANGITRREMNGRYYIGDIKLKLSNRDGNIIKNEYNLTIAKNYRGFSEITYDENTKNAHLFGITEGLKNINLNKILSGITHDGIFLREDLNNKIIYPAHLYMEPSSMQITGEFLYVPYQTSYFDLDNNEKVNAFDISDTKTFVNMKDKSGKSLPLNVSFSVEDASFYGYEPNIIKNEFNGIKFFDKAFVSANSLIFSGNTTEKVNYYMLPITDYEDFLKFFRKMNVNDEIDKSDIFKNAWNGRAYPNYNYNKLKIIKGVGDNDIYYAPLEQVSQGRYVMGIYNNYTLGGEGDVYSSVKKHTSNLSIIKIYKLY